MTKLVKLAVVVIAALATACDSEDLTSMRQVDRDFILKASEANLAEIELGELAATKATVSSVRNFGEMMITEHQAAYDELESIAIDKSTAIATSINFEHQEIKQNLTEMSGYAFDTAYMRRIIKDHEKIIELFETEISNGNDPHVQDFAIQYLPQIQRHHHKADSISLLINQ